MRSATAFTVRRANDADEPTLVWLGALAGQPSVRRPALIGDVDGVPTAAISLADGRGVADPFRPTAGVVAHLRLYRSGWRPRGDTMRRHLRVAWSR
jgi:hypothetical protein